MPQQSARVYDGVRSLGEWRAQREAFRAARRRVEELGGARLTARRVKIFADGCVEEGTAALLGPYLEPSSSGYRTGSGVTLPTSSCAGRARTAADPCPGWAGRGQTCSIRSRASRPVGASCLSAATGRAVPILARRDSHHHDPALPPGGRAVGSRAAARSRRGRRCLHPRRRLPGVGRGRLWNVGGRAQRRYSAACRVPGRDRTSAGADAVADMPVLATFVNGALVPSAQGD
jgi:hypothetical protein